MTAIDTETLSEFKRAVVELRWNIAAGIVCAAFVLWVASVVSHGVGVFLGACAGMNIGMTFMLVAVRVMKNVAVDAMEAIAKDLDAGRL